MLEAGGGYLGSTLGAFAFDLLGFQWATVVESGVRFIVTNLEIICIFKLICLAITISRSTLPSR